MVKLYQKKNSSHLIALVIYISLFSVDTYGQACPLIPASSNLNQSLDIKQDTPVYKQLEEVIVVGYNKRMIVCGWSITGLRGKKLSNLRSDEGTLLLCRASGVYITASNYVNDSIKPVLPKASIKLYPNPTHGGSAVNFKFKNENSGNYKIEIIDASGRIIQTEYVNILFKKQVISFSTSPAWTKGVYLVRISGQNSPNVEIGKLAIN